jgi:membrane protease YdiL (CAAX protease family)
MNPRHEFSMSSIAPSPAHTSAAPSSESRRSPWLFFLLVALLSVPFALLGSVTRLQLMPGIPISALGFACPAIAAAILRYRERGRAGLAALIRRSLEFKRSLRGAWLVPVLLLMPSVALITLAIMRARNIPHPAPRFPLPASLVLFAAFLIAALGEEMGWSGYAIDALQQRWTALLASIVLGVIWAAWHIVAMVQTGQSASWIAWGCLDMVATRVIMVWIYNNTGRPVIAVVLFHAIANLTFKSIFPGGSYESERIISVLLTIIATIFTLEWGPRTLTRTRAD